MKQRICPICVGVLASGAFQFFVFSYRPHWLFNQPNTLDKQKYISKGFINEGLINQRQLPSYGWPISRGSLQSTILNSWHETVTSKWHGAGLCLWWTPLKISQLFVFSFLLEGFGFCQIKDFIYLSESRTVRCYLPFVHVHEPGSGYYVDTNLCNTVQIFQLKL